MERQPRARRLAGRLRRRIAVVAALAIAWLAAVSAWAALPAFAGSLTGLGWALSNSTVSHTSTSYTFTFTTATNSSLTKVTMTVPSGTGGAPTVGTVSGVPAGGAVGLAANTLTYTFTSTGVSSGTLASIQINGLTNTSTNGSYTSTISTLNGASTIDSGTTPGVNITNTLSTLGWALSNPLAGATAVSYTYTFHTTTAGNENKVTMTVPSGTAGSPTVGTVTPASVATGGSVSLSGTTLSYTFTSASIASNTSVSIQVSGLTNTSTSGGYSSTITTFLTASAIDSGVASASITGNLTGLGWSVSSPVPSATSTYTYTFTTATSSTLSKVTMTVPSGTAGTPAVGTVSGIPSGGVSAASNTLTYSFTPGTINAGTSVSIQITGMTNTSTNGSYTSQIGTFNSSTPVDAGTTPAVVIAPALASPSWAASSQVTGATSVAYSYAFTTSSLANLTSVTMTVPAGTGGTVSGVPSGGSVSLSGTTLTYSFSSSSVPSSTPVHIQITGITNTSTGGTYSSTITTVSAGGPVNTGQTAGLDIAGALTSLSWSVSNSAPSATAVGYTYAFTTSTNAATLTKVSMTVPSGTAGTPAVGTITGVPSGGSVSLSGTTLTYTFTAHSTGPSQAVSIQITGMTNTATPGSYTSTISTLNGTSLADEGVTTATTIGGSLVSPMWSVSSQTAGASGVSYTYTFTTASTATLNKVTMSVPAGTSGTFSVGTVTPAAVAAGGSVSGGSNTLTYTFSAASISAGTAVSIQITGLTNTFTTGVYTSLISTFASGGAGVDGGTTPGVVIGGTLGSPSWGVSSAALSATGVTYNYNFTVASNSNLNTVTMSVPPGTGGSPAVGTVTPPSVASGGAVSLTGTTLTYTFSSAGISSGTTVDIHVTGLTNTSTTGTYTSTIATYNSGTVVDGGTTAAVSFPASLTLTSPGSLTWAITSNGTDQPAVDTVSADQQLSVSDFTGSGAGWHITVAATTFTNGSHTLADSGTFGFTGSLSSSSATASPSSACVGSCILPANTTTYPVPITTAASSPTAVTVYDTSAGTGVGTITIGGHSATHPVGWWTEVPASAVAGSYTSTITVTLVSGP